jgi:hypothetical protein
MTYVHKCKFPDKEIFDNWQKSEEENADIITVVEIGEIPDIDGYHIDVMAYSVIESLLPYVVDVKNPLHGVKWAEGSEIVKAIK